MQWNGEVEVALGRAHAYRDREALQHLVHPVPDHVDPEHAFVLAGADEFHRHRRDVVPRKGAGETAELRLVDADRVTERLHGRGFGQSDTARGRMGEGDGRNLRIVHRHGFALRRQPVVGQPAPCRNRHGRQWCLADHVAERKYARHAGLLPFVHRNDAVGQDLDAGGLEADVAGLRAPAHGPQHALERTVPLVLAGMHGDRARRPLEARDRRAEVPGDSLLLHVALEHVADHRVEHLQHPVLHRDDRHVNAKGAQHAGHLETDVSRADDRDGLRQVLPLEEVIGGRPEFVSRHPRDDRFAAGGDDHPFAAVFPAAGGHRAGIDELRALGHVVDAEPLEVAGPVVVEHPQEVMALAHQVRIAQVPDLDIHTEFMGMAGVAHVMGRVPGELLRDAALVNAGPPERPGIEDRDPGTVPCSPLGHSQTAAASADHEDVVLFHVGSRSVYGRGCAPVDGAPASNECGVYARILTYWAVRG